MADGVERCLKCGAQFTPQGDTHQCPSCSSNATIGLGAASEMKEPPRAEKTSRSSGVKCPACGTDMVLGLLQEMSLIDRTIGHPVLTWRKQALWSKGYYVDAYACPRCGRVEVRIPEPDLRESPIA